MRNIIIALSSLLITYTSSAQVPTGAGNRPGAGRTQVTGAFYGKLIEAKSLKPIATSISSKEVIYEIVGSIAGTTYFAF